MQRCEAQGLAAGAAVHEGIGGPLGRGGVFTCGQRFDLGLAFQQPQGLGLLADRHREVVPAGGTGITPLLQAAHPLSKHRPTGRRQAGGVGGAAHLVGHHPQLRPLPVQAQHREAEVLTHRPIEPTGAQHTGPLRPQQLQHRRLTPGLGGAVHPQGGHRVLGAVGVALLATENEIRADLQHPAAAQLRQGLGKGPGGAGIHRFRQLRLLFGLVHRRVGAPIQ